MQSLNQAVSRFISTGVKTVDTCSAYQCRHISSPADRSTTIATACLVVWSTVEAFQFPLGASLGLFNYYFVIRTKRRQVVRRPCTLNEDNINRRRTITPETMIDGRSDVSATGCWDKFTHP
uniref:Uncharacterized protein n=1 Tax=Anopheles farauti TaxID=69004 RepID=A0A182QI11_9DIPT